MGWIHKMSSILKMGSMSNMGWILKVDSILKMGWNLKMDWILKMGWIQISRPKIFFPLHIGPWKHGLPTSTSSATSTSMSTSHVNLYVSMPHQPPHQHPCHIHNLIYDECYVMFVMFICVTEPGPGWVGRAQT
jgi:hypothetical protein